MKLVRIDVNTGSWAGFSTKMYYRSLDIYIDWYYRFSSDLTVLRRSSLDIGPQCEILEYGTRSVRTHFSTFDNYMFQLIDALYSYNINHISTRNSRRDVPPVRAMLVALDQCGFRTVVVEKTQPGPFGFYIATGVMNGQRGIFISRVSIPSLSPMLSVGDEILYVDDQLVKGRSLETVQALIAGKTKVLIVLLPAIGSYIY
ncbi:unnamed protein product [Heligmosomoides polygyrus]|uniref:PDZ domain-containing protein n=1 Tax=Heligmosomoides polygyrus TaxID=6339 RepID=A0A3P7YD13_HELPZ|nr:unnamed protein product [Heligmosomoides polygyrus]